MNPRKLSSVQKEHKILEIMEMFCAENDLTTLFTCAISPLNLQIMIEIRYLNNLTPRRPIGKVTPTCPICRARQFRWRRCLTVSKMPPMFSQVLKTLLRFLDPKFISEIARNYLISSKFLVRKKRFMVTPRLWVCALSIPAWLIDDKVISSIPFIINNLH